MRKYYTMILIFLSIAILCFFLDNVFAMNGVVLAMAVVGGPFKELKFGALTLRPTKDGGAKYEESGSDYEVSISPNGDPYSTASARPGYVQQECAFTASEFSEFKKLQDGEPRAGTATAQNGDVITINATIDGEHVLDDGKCEVKLSGKVKIQ